MSDTCDRVLPYYRANILPKLKGETTLLVAAHGNSLRALIKDLEQLSADEIVKVEVPTGVPIVYTVGDSGAVTDKKVLE